MATDFEAAQKILGIQQAVEAGELDAATAQQLLDESGLEQPIDPAATPPASLAVNAPEALGVAPSSDFVMPQPGPPEAISALQNMEAQQAEQQTAQDQAIRQGLDYQLGTNYAEQVAAQQAVQPSVGRAPAAVVPEVVEEAVPVLPEPTAEQRAKSEAEIIAPVQQARADHEATKVAAAGVESDLAKEAANLQKQQDALENQIKAVDTSVRERSLSEIMRGSNIGDKFGAAIAVLLGGLSQGLTGAKSNPVLDFIDKQVAAQAEKDKLSAEQKLSLKKQLIEIAQLRMQNAANKSTDQYHKDSLAVEREKLEVERQKNEAAQALKAKEYADKFNEQADKLGVYQGKEVTPEMAQKLNEIETKSLVTVRGKKYKTNNPDAAKSFSDDYKVRQSAVAKLEPYKALVEKGIWRTLGEKGVMATLKDYGKAGTMEQAIVGALRLPYTGPGALNQGEREGLLNNIGKFGLFSLPSVEADKVKFIIHDLQAEMQRQANDAGLSVQVTPSTFLKLEGGKYMDKNLYFQQKAEQTGRTVDEIERLYNMTQQKRVSSGQ